MIGTASSERPLLLATVALAAVLLALACLVSAISGFFDGALANDELSGGLVAWQVFLLTATAAVGVLAIARARELWRAR